MALKLQEKIRSLPARQQLALWVLLKKRHKRGKFTIIDFMKEMMPFLKAKDDAELARMLGGLLSSLLRNGMVERLSGGRQPIWRILPELHSNAEKYRKAIYPTATYWMD